MLGIMLRALLHVICFTALIPFKILVLLWLVVASTVWHFKGIMTYRESWGHVWLGMKETWEVDMDIIRNGF